MVRFKDLPPEFWREFRLWSGVKGEFSGLSPPGNFVGSYNYPNINVGALVSDDGSNALDSPEEWFRRDFTQLDVLRFRLNMVLARTRVSVKSLNNPVIDRIQELSIGHKPVDVEVRFRRSMLRFLADDYHAPIGGVGEVESLRLTSNVSAERIVERLVNDFHVNAKTAVIELYRAGILISRIQRIFSVGLLGSDRRLVPTRWSITAVDSIIGDYLRDKVRGYGEVSDVEVHMMEYMGNRYFVLLIPGPWMYELIELKMPGSLWNRHGNSPRVFIDREGVKGMSSYAEETGGAFYAVRLGILEYLERIRRRATAIAIREVTPEYTIPVGIWQAREAVRNGMGINMVKFSSVDEAINYLNNKLLTGSLWTSHSMLLRSLGGLNKFLI
ncbi:MAG: hypothetical protein TU36_004015 [Vulcanisaeta sp. AZ3]|nr:MAG: hypothetical protein TU36_05005 [Vulcanisaeta sp. AZ3]